jgi:pimeloyl-ACP methyl ester carboxylesterase
MKEKLLILHGAAGSKERFEKILGKLEKHFDVYRLNFAGHGGEKFPDEPFSVDLFAHNVIDYLNNHEIRQVNIFGYSLGGYVAIYLASHFPERVLKIFTLGTKFNWSKETVKQQIKLLDTEVIEEKRPDYAVELAALHHPNDWREVISKTVAMIKEMGKKNPLSDDDLADLNIPVLISMGDRDNLVIIEESVFSYRLLKKGQLLILPDTPHPMHNTNPDALARAIRRFIEGK